MDYLCGCGLWSNRMQTVLRGRYGEGRAALERACDSIYVQSQKIVPVYNLQVQAAYLRFVLNYVKSLDISLLSTAYCTV